MKIVLNFTDTCAILCDWFKDRDIKVNAFDHTITRCYADKTEDRFTDIIIEAVKKEN